MTGATASLPDLGSVSDASLNVQSGLSALSSFAGALSSGSPASPLSAVSGALGGLGSVLDIDVSGLSQRLPAALATIENALPADTLRFVEELEGAYAEVSDFLANSDLVRQMQPGRSLEDTALALVDGLLGLFQSRLGELGASLLAPEILAGVRAALATIEQLASGAPLPAGELLEFLSQNLIGVAPDFLSGATQHVEAALGPLLEPFSAAALDARLGPTRDALTAAFRTLAQSIAAFDPADSAAYSTLSAELDFFSAAHAAALDALASLYTALAAVVASPAWDALFGGYRSVLAGLRVASELPTIDDAVDALAGTLEALLSQLSMLLSPADLAAQVQRVTRTIHDLFAQSALSQVEQILLGFVGKIQAALEQIPTREVREAVEGMLGRVRDELSALGIDQVRASIEGAFQGARDFVQENIGSELASGVSDALGSALTQLEQLPIEELGQALAQAVSSAGQVVDDLISDVSSGLDEIETLLATLDSVDFRPVADEVIDEIGALKAKLSAMRPDALSDVERVAIQAALSVLRAIDLEGMIANELEDGFAVIASELRAAVQKLLDAWLEFRRRIGGLDAASLTQGVGSILAQVGSSVQSVNGSLVVAPLEQLVDGLISQLEALSPEAILDPLREPYQRILQTIERANPDVWVEPLRALHAEIDRLVALVDITPLLQTLEEKEQALFAAAQQALVSALDAVELPAPLDAFFDQMKSLVLAFTGAIFGDPDGEIQKFNLSLTESVRLSTLFQPLDAAFDQLLAAFDGVPPDQLLGALRTIQQGIGVALPALDPDNILRALGEARGRLAALDPAALSGTLALPALHVRLGQRLSEHTGNTSQKAALLVRFDAALAPLDPSVEGSALRRAADAHRALAASLAARIDALDASGAQAEFQRVNSGLRRVLPAFLMQPAPLELGDVRAGLASLRPSTKARRIDLAVDRFFAELAPLADALETATGAFFAEIRNAALALHPGRLEASVAGVYTTLREKLHVLDPDELAASLREDVWEPLLDPLRAIDPEALKAQLHALYQSLLEELGAAVHGLIDQVKAAIDGFLVDVRQALSQVLGALNEQIGSVLEDVEALIAKLDQLVVNSLFERLLRLIDNLNLSFDQELDRVKNEFDAMLSAIPLGGSASVRVA